MEMEPIDVAALRRRLGWSQEKLAEKLGVHQTTVSKWERGEPMSLMARKALERIRIRKKAA